MSSKQRNLISYQHKNLIGYLTGDEMTAFLKVCDSYELTPEDASILVGNTWNMQKDEREGIKDIAEYRAHLVKEIKEIVACYTRKCAMPECNNTGRMLGSFCSDCYTSKGSRSFEALKQTQGWK